MALCSADALLKSENADLSAYRSCCPLIAAWFNEPHREVQTAADYRYNKNHWHGVINKCRLI